MAVARNQGCAWDTTPAPRARARVHGTRFPLAPRPLSNCQQGVTGYRAGTRGLQHPSGWGHRPLAPAQPGACPQCGSPVLQGASFQPWLPGHQSPVFTSLGPEFPLKRLVYVSGCSSLPSSQNPPSCTGRAWKSQDVTLRGPMRRARWQPPCPVGASPGCSSSSTQEEQLSPPGPVRHWSHQAAAVTNCLKPRAVFRQVAL